MFVEPTTLATVTRLLESSLREHYGVDPAPIYKQAGIPMGVPETTDTRYPLDSIKTAWKLAREATGDEAIGLVTGRNAEPPQFYAFGFSWLASATLLDALQRLTRYIKVVSTASAELTLTETPDSYQLSATFPEASYAPPREGLDCGMTALLALCDHVAGRTINPIRISMSASAPENPAVYREALRAPVEFGVDIGAMHFRKEDLQARLPNAAPDVARATDRVIEQYMETLDPTKVASQVRRLLVELLPAGDADQDIVCDRLNRSRSSLRRQLREEGLTYRDILDSTRQRLAKDYLKSGRYAHAQIAFMLGFSDQSNFARAFKRWTSLSPGQYQEQFQ